ncbi:hypothetical protein [Sphingopyxis sp.]|uniref:hypothetical protein n=1 Tax=Sphingopyxis sp. TaxID=1908224 RepID=UPI003D106F45
MSDAIKRTLRIVAFQSNDAWIAQCIEYDVCAQGSDVAQAMRRIKVALDAEAEFTRVNHGKEFAGIDAAPDFYEAMFEESEASLTSDMDFRIAA